MTGATTSPEPSFSYEGAHRPLRLRMFNTAGRVAGPVGRRFVSLSADSVIRAAERKSGLTAPPDEEFREPVARLLESIESDADLNTTGRWGVRTESVDLVSKRLRILDYLDRHPEVLDVPVERPLFIVGFPRTGSTVLHNLMALDPGNRVPLLWELLNPIPPDQPLAPGGHDPRLAEAREYINTVEYLSPVALRVHPMGAVEPDECRLLLEPGFVGPQYLLYYRIPGYFDWFSRLSDERLEAACVFMRGQIQILKRDDGGARWVGKNPSHSFFGRGLVRAFPDACIVHLHRDPEETIPSICSLVAAYRSICSDALDPGTLGQDGLDMFCVAMDRMLEMRTMPPPATFCEVDYRQLVSDPIGAVRRIYDHAGMWLAPEVEQRMERYVASHPQHQGGVHRYSGEQFGISREEIRAGTKRYREWFEDFGS